MSILSLARGLSIGTGITDSRRIEDSVRVGRNATLTALTQMAQLNYTFALSNEALVAAGGAEVPIAARVITYLTPAALAFAIKSGIDNPILRDLANFVQEHLGLVCQVASVVSSIALVVFGHVILGVTSLAILAIGFLDRMGLLPEAMRHFIHEYSPVIRVATGILVGDAFEKLFALASLALYGYGKYVECTSPPEPILAEAPIIRSDRTDRLDINLLRQILNGQVALEINPAHIDREIRLPPPPNVEIGELNTIADRIDWTHHVETIRNKLLDDPRFTEINGSPRTWTPAALITFVKNNLHRYVDAVVNRSIVHGEIHDYERLQGYLKHVAHELPQKNEITQADALLRIAIEGADYCGPAMFHVGEELYSELVLGMKELPILTKVLYALQDGRNSWMEALYGQSIELLNQADSCMTRIFLFLFDLNDRHMYHQFINMYGTRFGLRRGAAENDHAAIVDPVARSVFRNLVEAFQEMFDHDYNADYAIETVQERMGYSELAGMDIFKFWADWVARQEISDLEKERLTEEIYAQQLLGTPIRFGDLTAPGEFNPPFIEAMLVDMGILRRAIG